MRRLVYPSALLGAVITGIFSPLALAQTIIPTFPAALNTTAATFADKIVTDEVPQVATDGSGHCVAVWQVLSSGVNTDIMSSRSSDNGATWTAPLRLNTNIAPKSGRDVSPTVKTDGSGLWIAVWSSGDVDGMNDTEYDIAISRSTNNGATWSAPVALNPDAATDTKGDWNPQMATDGFGHWVVTFTVASSFLHHAAVSRSSDNGVTWTAPAAMYTNAVTNQTYDTRPLICTDGLGHWVATWTSTYDGLGGIGPLVGFTCLVSRSEDNGAVWTAPVPLKTREGSDYGGSVATDGLGHWVAVLASTIDLGGGITGQDIVVCRSTDNGLTWSAAAPLNPNAGASGTFEGGGDPVVMTDVLGNWVATWSAPDVNIHPPSTGGVNSGIRASCSIDNGATWSTPIWLDSKLPSDYDNAYPQLAADQLGRWVAVWRSRDNLGNTADNDSDILVSRWVLPDLNNLFVNFNNAANGIGTQTSPFHNLFDALTIANIGATLHLAPGNSPAVFVGTDALGRGNRPMSLQKSDSGSTPVRIGTP